MFNVFFYAGLNPLIYAVSVLILLGSLALVILLTCWIRVRRSYNRQHYRLTNNPQDYLDYISDNDLTPLASSELAASFEERPPSYSESEEMNSKTVSSREGQNGGRIIESVLRRSRVLSSSVLRQNSSDRNTSRESSERANGPPTVRIFLPRPTLTLPRTVATVRPRPSTSHLTSRSTSHNTTSEQDTEPCTATEGNMDGIGDQNRGFPQVLSLPQTICTASNVEGSSGVMNNAPGCLSNELVSSGADALDQNTRNGNGTHSPSSEPISQPESNHEIPVGMLIDLT